MPSTEPRESGNGYADDAGSGKHGQGLGIKDNKSWGRTTRARGWKTRTMWKAELQKVRTWRTRARGGQRELGKDDEG